MIPKWFHHYRNKHIKMKKILVPTDFSGPANNAALYSLQLAAHIKANINLCNVIKLPATIPGPVQIGLPIIDFSTLKEETEKSLKLLTEKLKEKLKPTPNSSPFIPAIEFTSQPGPVAEVIRTVYKNNKMNLVVMGMSGENSLNKFLIGSSSKEMIEKANFPLLLIPADAKFKGIKKIAFATDLSEADVLAIHSLAGLASVFGAEILITHVTDKKVDLYQHQLKVAAFLNDITCKVNYNKIYYRHIRNKEVNDGLEWLADYGQIDMLVMVHRLHSIIDQVFKGSHTQKLAKRIALPLLVFPAIGKTYVL